MRKLLNNLKSDESLMLAYQKGDVVAFEVLYQRHKNGLFAFLYRSCGQPAVVEELAQDAWMSVIRSVERYQATAKFKSYLFQIAHNKLVDHWRRTKLQLNSVDVDEIEIANNVLSMDDHQASERNLQTINTAVLSLPTEQRDAFLLREEGFSQDQIAQIVGAGKETVKSRLRYAGKHLRAILASGFEDQELKLTGVVGAKR